MSETKTPQAGEWWISDDGSIAFIVGTKRNGDVICENAMGHSYPYLPAKMQKWHHEPQCDSFDWKEPAPPDPGEGYEILKPGVLLQEGDEWLTEGVWSRTANAGKCRVSGNIYRRKIVPAKTIEVSPGKGWRWVESNEPWAAGDECLICDGKYPHSHNCQSWVRRVLQAEWSDMAAIQNLDLRRSEMASSGRLAAGDNQAIIQVIDIAKRAITWPKYYVGKNWSDADAYVRVDNENAEFVWVDSNGTEQVFRGNTYRTIPLCVEQHSWREITEAEAMARVKPDLCTSDPH